MNALSLNSRKKRCIYLLGLVLIFILSASLNAQTPIITFSSSKFSVIQGSTIITCPFKTQYQPTHYALSFQNSIFPDVAQWTELPESPLQIDIPNGVEPGNYISYIIVRNDSSGLVSIEKMFVLEILPGIIPTFDPIQTLFANSATLMLPSVSNNEIIGTWSIGTQTVIDADTKLFTYIFKPNIAQFAQKTSIRVRISKKDEPIANIPNLEPINDFSKLTTDGINSKDVGAIEYIDSVFCQNSDPIIAKLSGVPGGIFTSQKGLKLDIHNGTITPSQSWPGIYDVYYQKTKGLFNYSAFYSTRIGIIPSPKRPFVFVKDTILVSSSRIGNQWHNSLGPIENATNRYYPPVYDDEYYTIVTLGGCESKPSQVVSYSSFAGLILPK